MRHLISIMVGVFLITLVFSIQTTMAQEDVGRLLKQVEEDSDRFSNTVSKALDSSKYDGTPAEDTMIRYVRAFEDSIDRLKKAYDGNQDRTVQVKEVQTRAKTIDKFLRKNDLGSTVQTDWATVRASLVRLARAHNVKPIG